MISTHCQGSRKSEWLSRSFWDFSAKHTHLNSFLNFYFMLHFSCLVQWEFLALYNCHISRIEALRIDFLIHYQILSPSTVPGMEETVYKNW